MHLYKWYLTIFINGMHNHLYNDGMLTIFVINGIIIYKWYDNHLYNLLYKWYDNLLYKWYDNHLYKWYANLLYKWYDNHSL